MTQQKSYPVRYIVLRKWWGFEVVDTLAPADKLPFKPKRVKWFVDWYGNDMAVLRAHKCALYRNEAEGYVYYPKV